MKSMRPMSRRRVLIPAKELGFDDKYLRILARESLAANPEDYRAALQHYEAALRVNPFGEIILLAAH